MGNRSKTNMHYRRYYRQNETHWNFRLDGPKLVMNELKRFVCLTDIICELSLFDHKLIMHRSYYILESNTK